GAFDYLRCWLKRFGSSYAQLETQLCRREDPGVGHIASAIPDKRDDLAFDRAALFLKRENVGNNLARMLLIRQRVDRGNAGVGGKFLDFRLGKCAEDRALNHPPENARSVLDRLAAPKLNFVGCKEDGFAAEFADADFKRDTRSRGGFGE